MSNLTLQQQFTKELKQLLTKYEAEIFCNEVNFQSGEYVKMMVEFNNPYSKIELGAWIDKSLSQTEYYQKEREKTLKLL
jgi:hypothetical protein